MIDKEHRVKKHEEFQKIIRSNKVEKNNSFVIYYENNEDDIVRVGISVSKKIGNAVKRNNIKRQVRHMFYNLKDNLQKVDVIIIVRQNYKNNSFLENQTILLHSLEKIRRKINEQTKKMV